MKRKMFYLMVLCLLLACACDYNIGGSTARAFSITPEEIARFPEIEYFQRINVTTIGSNEKKLEQTIEVIEMSKEEVSRQQWFHTYSKGKDYETYIAYVGYDSNDNAIAFSFLNEQTADVGGTTCLLNPKLEDASDYFLLRIANVPKKILKKVQCFRIQPVSTEGNPWVFDNGTKKTEGLYEIKHRCTNPVTCKVEAMRYVNDREQILAESRVKVPANDKDRDGFLVTTENWSVFI